MMLSTKAAGRSASDPVANLVWAVSKIWKGLPAIHPGSFPEPWVQVGEIKQTLGSNAKSRCTPVCQFFKP
jgi:hypothetical protein